MVRQGSAGRGRAVRLEINVGSRRELTALRTGVANVAGTHLLNASKGYNFRFVKEYRRHCIVLVKGYLQQQGIITRKGELIPPLDDLSEAQFINRNAGSGTRV